MRLLFAANLYLKMVKSYRFRDFAIQMNSLVYLQDNDLCIFCLLIICIPQAKSTRVGIPVNWESQFMVEML